MTVTRQEVYDKEVEISKNTKISIGLAVLIVCSVVGGAWAMSERMTRIESLIQDNSNRIDRHVRSDRIHQDFGQIPDIYMRKETAQERWRANDKQFEDLRKYLDSRFNSIESQYHDIKSELRKNGSH